MEQLAEGQSQEWSGVAAEYERKLGKMSGELRSGLDLAERYSLGLKLSVRAIYSQDTDSKPTRWLCLQLKFHKALPLKLQYLGKIINQWSSYIYLLTLDYCTCLCGSLARN